MIKPFKFDSSNIGWVPRNPQALSFLHMGHRDEPGWFESIMKTIGGGSLMGTGARMTEFGLVAPLLFQFLGIPAHYSKYAALIPALAALTNMGGKYINKLSGPSWGWLKNLNFTSPYEVWANKR